MNTIPLDELEAKLLANPEVKAAYDALEQEYAIARELIAARARAGLSLAQLVAKMNLTSRCATDESRMYDYLRENSEAIIAQYVEKISAENLTQKVLIERLAFIEWLLDTTTAQNELLKANYMQQESKDELVSRTEEYSFDIATEKANERHSPTKDKTAALNEIGEEYNRRVESGEIYDEKGVRWKGKGTAAKCLAIQFKQHEKYWPLKAFHYTQLIAHEPHERI